MELESTEITAQVYETLKNINLAISKLQTRSVEISSEGNTRDWYLFHITTAGS